MSSKRKEEGNEEDVQVTFTFPDGKSAIVSIFDKNHGEEFEHFQCASGEIVKIPPQFAAYRSKNLYFWNNVNLSTHLQMLPKRYQTELSEGLNACLSECAAKGSFVWSIFEQFKMVLSLMFDADALSHLEEFDVDEICDTYKSVLHYADVGWKCERALNSMINMKKISESMPALQKITSILRAFEPQSEREREIADIQLSRVMAKSIRRRYYLARYNRSIQDDLKFGPENDEPFQIATLEETPNVKEFKNVLSKLETLVIDYSTKKKQEEEVRETEQEKEWSKMWEEKEWMEKVLTKK